MLGSRSVLLVSVLLLAGAALSVPAQSDGEAVPVVSDHVVASFDGTTIALTVFQPVNATAEAPAPLVLHSHGWGGARATSVGGIVADLLDAGYGVLSFDARGHGDSGGYATVHHRDWEVKDTQAILDWAFDELDWVAKELAAALAYYDADASGSFTADDTLYVDAGGSAGAVGSHDARLTAFGAIDPGTYVGNEDPDVGLVLATNIPSLVALSYLDWNANAVFDAGDTLYYHPTGSTSLVHAGSVRLTSFESEPAGTTVEAGDPDLTLSLGPWGSPASLCSYDADGNGAVGAEDTIYVAPDGCASVQPGQVRLTPFGSLGFGTIASSGDADIDLATLPVAGSPAAKDLLLGAVGGSYGGGYQTTAHTHDARFDALVPQMTWNDLTYSLAPGGVVKSTWVDALYGAGLANVDMDPRIHDWFRAALLDNELPAEAAGHFAGSAPDPSAFTAATLWVQGIPDALFNLNEALANHHAALSGGAESALVTYLGGHVLPGVQPTGFMGPARGSEPCGAYSELALSWFDKHLRGNASADVPSGISYATEQGSCVTIGDYAAGTAHVGLELGTLAAPVGGGSLLVPLDAPAGTIAGIPTLETDLQAVAPADAILSFGLVMQSPDGRLHVVDDQAAFLRVDALPLSSGTGTINLTGVATDLADGYQLFLRIDAVNEWAPTGGTRGAGVITLSETTLRLPYIA